MIINQEHYRIHIYIAESNTPLLDPNYKPKIIPIGNTSLAGHMWYSIQKDNELEQSYGFMSVHGKPAFDKGKVSTVDNYVYYRPRHKRTMVIEREKYQKLKDFGERQEVRLQNNFKDKYNVSLNSCIDFTWFALKYAGFYWRNSEIIFNEQAGEYQIRAISPSIITSDYGGDLIPSSNWDDVLRIINPSDLNEKLSKLKYLNDTTIDLSAEETIKDFYVDAVGENMMLLMQETISVFKQAQIEKIRKKHQKYILENPLPKEKQELSNDNLNSDYSSWVNTAQTTQTCEQTSQLQPLFQGAANLESKLACR